MAALGLPLRGSRAMLAARLKVDPTVAATPRRVYANAHAYHINSMSLNSDGETFISSDDLRINLWNLEINDRAFSE